MKEPVPLTHHQILELVAPFSRRGRRVDLAASDRIARLLRFKPLEHAAGEAGLPALHDQLELECLAEDDYRLTRRLATPDGLEAVLVAEGADVETLAERVDAVPRARQFRFGAGWAAAFVHRIRGAAGGATSLIVAEAHGRVGALAVKAKVSPVSGIPADLELLPAPEPKIELPEDLLAVLGWPWTCLNRIRDGWRGGLRLKGSDVERSDDAEAKFVRTLEHLAETLAGTPQRFHERLHRERWRVTLRRSVPIVTALALIAGAAMVPSLELAQDSIWRMVIFHSPTFLLILLFTMREMPRLEIPPVPRLSHSGSWTPMPAPPPDTR